MQPSSGAEIARYSPSPAASVGFGSSGSGHEPLPADRERNEHMGKFSIVATIKTVPGKRDAGQRGAPRMGSRNGGEGLGKGHMTNLPACPILRLPEYMGHLASTPSMEPVE
jgi:hypothetical protein